MAETKFRREGTRFVVIQSRWRGLKTREVVRLESWQDKLWLRPLGHGTKVDDRDVAPWDRTQLNQGNVVSLPWGGRFEVTDDVVRGGEPSIMEG